MCSLKSYNKMAKFKIFFKILTLLYTTLQISTTYAIKPRIVGGTANTISKEPYLIHLLEDGQFSCGGTLVSSRFVVTAAHCVKGVKPRRLIVVAGASKLSDTGVRSKVSKYMMPRGFTLSNMNLDVAVLKLRTTLTGPDIRTIGLCGRTWPVGATIQVSGWGVILENSEIPSNRVRTVQVKGISKSKCAADYRRESTSLSKNMICASVSGEKDACYGDSGGPAVYNGQLCGIVSWGFGCARKGFPGIYTNVAALRKFIQRSMTK